MATNPKIHVFPNGFRLIYESQPSVIPQTHIRAFCNVGSIYEPKHLYGASHFIEHMCFKGSCKFPSWLDVNEPFSRGGANFNAYTEKQYTCFVVDCLESYVHPFLTILGDIMLRSTFGREEYNLERNVVREEMIMKSQKSFIEDIALRGSAYSRPIDHISYHQPVCLPYDEVFDFYRQYYVSQNIVVSIVSSIPFETILLYITSTAFVTNTNFVNKSRGRVGTKLKIKKTNNNTKKRHKSRSISCRKYEYTNTPPIIHPNLGAVEDWTPDIKRILLYKSNKNTSSPSRKSNKTANMSIVEIGINVCNQFNDFEYYCLHILQQVIYGGKPSRLFSELREKRGLTYRSGSYINLYETCGIFVLYAISDSSRLLHYPTKQKHLAQEYPESELHILNGGFSNRSGVKTLQVFHRENDQKRDKHKGTVPVMFDILEDIVKNGITDSEFKLAKQFIKESLKMQSIAGGEKSVYNGLRLMLHNDTSIMTNANMYDKCYKHITKHDIHKIIEKYFAGRKYFMSISGDNLPKQSKFAGFLLPPINNLIY